MSAFVKSKSVSILLSIAIFSIAASTTRAHGDSQFCAAGACFSASVGSGSTGLPLLGVAVLEYYIWEVYSIALYGPKDAVSSDKILADVPKRLSIYYLRSINRSDIIDAADKFLKSSPQVNYKAIEPRVELINSWYQSVKKGDRYELEYAPGVGTSLIFNGEKQGTIPGADFSRAYFAIWLGRQALDEDLRDQLLEGS